ncbi:glutamate receptor ionotropic, NMDA 2A-like [Stylophora pistillata]|uniref:glutamate receptor ionotropic, NMDA 2A-like n=1 Tax=Stylophora pistillata TaxID=50429 RepID=UPI000C051C94|nr:glutamate receptor ionotropic, NMDA 2A-like [Stylophora pistillata]
MMFQNFCKTYIVSISLLQCLCGSINTITTHAVQPVVKFVFISEEIQRHDLNSTFEHILKRYTDVSSLLSLQGTALAWNQKETPHFLWRKIQEHIIEQNASMVISFLPPKKNYVLVDVLSKSAIPIIGLQSLTEEFYKSYQESSLYLSILPSDALQAGVIVDLMLEFEESRFVCITTKKSRDDALLSYLLQYTANIGHQATSPRCIILRENSLLEDLGTALAAISNSGVRLVVVHCQSNESTAIISLANKLSLKLLRRDVYWIFTHKAVTIDANAFPEGSFGVQMFQGTGNASMVSLYKGLLQDSVELFVLGLKSSLDWLTHCNKLDCLQGGLFTAFKRQLYREMVHRSFTGQTGFVQFSNNGKRTSFKFALIKALRLHDLKHDEADQYWHVLGYACPEMTLYNSPHNFEAFLPTDLPRPRHLRIVTVKHAPFTAIHDVDYSSRMGTSCPENTVPCREFLKDNDTLFPDNEGFWKRNEGSSRLQCCYGVMIDILIKIQEIEDFSFDLYLVKDGKYGSVDSTTKPMNGMIGDVYRGTADFALGGITITEERSKYVSFTTPYSDTALMFLVRRFEANNKTFAQIISDMRLMKSFRTELWLMCLIAFCAVAVTSWVFEKVYYYRNHKSAYLLPFEYMAYVYGNIFHVPLTKIQAKTYAVPSVMVVANFAALVLVSSYTANLLASLVTVEETNIVSGIADDKLVDPPKGFIFATIKDTSTEDFFRKSQSARLRKIHENMKDHNVETFSDGLKKLRSGELTAFISETGADDDPNCEIKEDGVPFELSGLAFALQKNSSWTRQISRAIHKLNAHDTIPHIFEKWTTSRCKVSQQTMVARPMGLGEFGGFFFNTAMICCGCFLLMLAEIVVYRKITRTRNSFSPQQCGKTQNVMSLPDSSSMTSILNN